MICGIYFPLLVILGHVLRESEGSCPSMYTNIIATERMLTTMTKAPMSTLGVYVGSFFPLICTAMVDASLPRILSVASTTYHVFSVVTWSAALGYHVVFHMSCKLKCSIRFMSAQVSHVINQRTGHVPTNCTHCAHTKWSQEVTFTNKLVDNQSPTLQNYGDNRMILSIHLDSSKLLPITFQAHFYWIWIHFYWFLSLYEKAMANFGCDGRWHQQCKPLYFNLITHAHKALVSNGLRCHR